MKIVLLLLSVCSDGQSWTTDFDQVKKNASNEDKKIHLVFSGSDWSVPCVKLEQTTWNSEAVNANTQKSWILVKADFPKKKANQLSEQLRKQNDQLAESYNNDGNFLGKTTYKNILEKANPSLLHAMETKV